MDYRTFAESYGKLLDLTEMLRECTDPVSKYPLLKTSFVKAMDLLPEDMGVPEDIMKSFAGTFHELIAGGADLTEVYFLLNDFWNYFGRTGGRISDFDLTRFRERLGDFIE